MRRGSDIHASSPRSLAMTIANGHASAGIGAPARRLDLNELLRNQREVEIVHAGRIYRLRLTASGKLILTA